MPAANTSPLFAKRQNADRSSWLEAAVKKTVAFSRFRSDFSTDRATDSPSVPKPLRRKRVCHAAVFFYGAAFATAGIIALLGLVPAET
jgi:hypothetical protein